MSSPTVLRCFCPRLKLPSRIARRFQAPQLVVHDPRDRSQLAYLAATKEGRRIYLNRLLTDADVVIPVGRLGYDPIMGHRGPVERSFPRFERTRNDRSSSRAVAERARGAGRCAGSRRSRRVIRGELAARSQFHVGVVPGFAGPSAFVVGKETAVRERGIAALDRSWKLDADSRRSWS